MLTVNAVNSLQNIEERERKQVLNKLLDLSEDPDKRGKPLVETLKGMRNVHTAGRYRIIYSVDRKKKVVNVLIAWIRKQGDRKDIYALAKKLVALNLVPEVRPRPGAKPET